MRKNPGWELEEYIAEKLREMGDSTARITKGSGNHNEIGDVSCKYFWIEVKQKHTKKNFIIDREKDWLKLANKVPIHSLKEVFIVVENKFGEKMICIKAEAFFRILERNYKEIENGS